MPKAAAFTTALNRNKVIIEITVIKQYIYNCKDYCFSMTFEKIIFSFPAGTV